MVRPTRTQEDSGPSQEMESADDANDQQADATVEQSPASPKQGTKRLPRFTVKQRMDIYAFCVLELELHSETVSVRKKRSAIKRAWEAHQKKLIKEEVAPANHQTSPTPLNSVIVTAQELRQNPEMDQHDTNPTRRSPPMGHGDEKSPTRSSSAVSNNQQHQAGASQNGDSTQRQLELQLQPSQPADQVDPSSTKLDDDATVQVKTDCSELIPIEEIDFEQIQQEMMSSCRTYTAYQRTLVLTSAMLKGVQARFAKYYPDSHIPSRSTIKHLFDKCLEHGNVEDIRNYRKDTNKAPPDELEQLLRNQPELSLRQLARRLNVSVGTVNRRCKALGLLPESVAIRHQQLAISKRQRQVKAETKAKTKASKRKQ